MLGQHRGTGRVRQLGHVERARAVRRRPVRPGQLGGQVGGPHDQWLAVGQPEPAQPQHVAGPAEPGVHLPRGGDDPGGQQPDVDQPVAGQQLEGLAQRHHADAELGGQVTLRGSGWPAGHRPALIRSRSSAWMRRYFGSRPNPPARGWAASAAAATAHRLESRCAAGVAGVTARRASESRPALALGKMVRGSWGRAGRGLAGPSRSWGGAVRFQPVNGRKQILCRPAGQAHDLCTGKCW